MNFKLDEEQQLLRDETQKLSREVFKDRAARWDQNSEVPWDNIKLLAEKGYFGLIVPEEHGGSGGSIFGLILALEQIASCNSALTRRRNAICQESLPENSSHLTP
jgi:acyl-CoA dehydrogenase